MTSIAFDPFKFVDRLKSVGFSDTQAKAVVECFRDVDLDQIVTRGDLSELKAEIFKWFIPLMLGQYGFLLALLLKH